MMNRKIVLALALMTLAGAVHASGARRGHELQTSRPAEQSESDAVAKAPEIDPASAMAGLTLLAGGLVVLRGRKVNR